MDQVIRPRDRFAVVPGRAELAAVTFHALDDFIRTHLGDLFKRVRGKRVAVLLLVFRMPARDKDTNLTMLGTAFRPCAVAAPWQSGNNIVKAIETLIKKMDV